MNAVIRSANNMHIIDNLLKIIDYLRMIFQKFGKTKAITFARSLIPPHKVYASYVFVVQCS